MSTFLLKNYEIQFSNGMNLFSPNEIKKILSEENIWPKKSLGQNFLINKGVLDKIIKLADLAKEDRVLEVGSGLGVLTLALAEKNKEVIAVEKDEKIAKLAEKIFMKSGLKNIKLIQADILKIDFADLKLKKDYKIVSNLPYNIASAVIQKFLEAKNPPKEMILMVQKEVGQRIVAKAPDMNLLALSIELRASAKIIDYVKAGSFWPKPKVDSAIIKIVPNKKKIYEKNAENILKIAKAAFSGKRKTILNTLSKNLKLPKEKTEDLIKKSGVDPRSRPETLFLEDWLKLSNILINI